MSVTAFAAIPTELRERDQWVVWRLERRRDGKPTKVPYRADGAGRADSTDPATWSTFEEAVAGAEELGAEGIGYVFSADDPFTGVDLDDCTDGDRLHPAAAEIVRLLDSYTEISPSGTGVKVIVRGSKNGNTRCRTGKTPWGGEFECYDCERFFTVTGDLVCDCPETIEGRQAELKKVLAQLLPADERIRSSGPVVPVDLDDQELIDRAMAARNGADFTRLWNGNTAGYGSHSDADLALCGMLAFWTGRDAGRIDSLFRDSGLIRDKWDEPRRDSTYGAQTINKAIVGTKDVYTPAAAGASKSRTLTDDGNAYKLVDLHGHDLRYVPGAGWYAWDGSRWLHDSSGEPMRRAREVAERLRHEAKLRVNEHGKDDDLGKAMVAHAKGSASRRGLDAMLAIARSDRRVIVDVAELDADPLLLNTPNGTIDLRTGRLRPHERGDLITRRAAVPYDPDAAAPTWSTFLERVLPTDEVREYAQRMVGAAAIGHNRDELVHVSYGPGANGKSKFSETIRTCLADYAATVDPELFLAQRGRSAAQPELARLRGVRLVTAAETEEGRRLNVGLVKALTGGDTIATRYLYANEIVEFVPVFSPWLRTNHRPAISDQSEAIWRRVRLVPFTVTIPRSERDTTLQGKLLAELPGVLRWIVDGARAYLEHGLDPPDEVVAATEAYREDEDVLGAFIADLCDVGEDYTVAASVIYGAWRDWCQKHGEEPGTAKAFGMRLEDAGYPATRLTDGMRARAGMQLRGSTKRQTQ